LQVVEQHAERQILVFQSLGDNPADAELPFREHDAMWLKLEDFAAFVANWEDKAANLQAIADDLALGLDSFVFLDDSPMERALVRSRLPQVAVPECGATPWEMLAALRRGFYFQGVSITTPGKVSVQASQVKVTAGIVTVNSALADFSGVVKCQVLQATTVIGTTYTPGAGNVW
jgi:predicted enzyme involved in methoxymalonyl-ACP biosynthesis